MSDEYDESDESKNEVEGEIGLTVGGKVGGGQVGDAGKAGQGVKGRAKQGAKARQGAGRGKGAKPNQLSVNILHADMCATPDCKPNPRKPKHAKALSLNSSRSQMTRI